MNYEQAKAELGDIVQKLERGPSLEEALQLWRRGKELAGVCAKYLGTAREELNAAMAE